MSLARNVRRALTRDGSWFQAVDKIEAPGQRRTTLAGEVVSPYSSLALPAVSKAVRTISEVAGAMPLHTYRRVGEGRDRATTHPAYSLLHDQPNPEETATEAWTRVFAHLAGWGEAFIGKGRTFGQVTALFPIEPGRMEVKRGEGGELIYLEHVADKTGSLTGERRPWPARDVIHVRLFTLDGLRGISPLRLHRETMGLGFAMQRHASQFFGEAAVPAGVLTVAGRIRDKAVKEAMREEWKDRHTKAREIAILEEGASYEAITVPMQDAQFVELSGMTVTDIANIFCMPASLLNGGTGDSLTYGNRESDALNFLTFTLTNPLRKIEQALSNDLDLFPKTKTFYVEFLRDSILQPNTLDRARFYTFALGDSAKPGWMDRAEVRQRENLPPEDEPAAPVAPPIPPADEPADDEVEDDARRRPNGNGNGGSLDELDRQLDIAEAIARVSTG